MAELEQTIIIKKIIKGGGGHHGGAWKVAYADFVTAMMAFFLLLWLLASTSKAQREGIAEYFTPTIGIAGAEGIGFKGGRDALKGVAKADLSPVGIVAGQTPQGPIAKAPDKPSDANAEQESKMFNQAKEEIKKSLDEDPNLSEFKDQILMEQTPEGLKIELTDADKKEMFTPGTATLTDTGKRVLKALTKIIEKLPNFISITGHTDAAAFARSNDYGNWELSSDRALAARRYMLSQNMKAERVGKIVGRADQEPLDAHDPKAIRNRRITLILLRGSHLEHSASYDAASRSILSVPRVDQLGRPKNVVAPPRTQSMTPEAPGAAKPADAAAAKPGEASPSPAAAEAPTANAGAPAKPDAPAGDATNARPFAPPKSD